MPASAARRCCSAASPCHLHHAPASRAALPANLALLADDAPRTPRALRTRPRRAFERAELRRVKIALPNGERACPVSPVLEIDLVRHGQSTWNVENLFTGWHDVDLSDLGTHRGEVGGRRNQEGRHQARHRVHLRAQARHPHDVERARRDRSHVAAGGAQLAPQRAPLRRAAGPRQGADRGEARRGAGEDLAPQL